MIRLRDEWLREVSTNRNEGGGYPRAVQIRSTGVLVGTWMLEAVCSILGAEFPSGSAQNRTKFPYYMRAPIKSENFEHSLLHNPQLLLWRMEEGVERKSWDFLITCSCKKSSTLWNFPWHKVVLLPTVVLIESFTQIFRYGYMRL